MKKGVILTTSALLVAGMVSAQTVVNIDFTHDASTGPTGNGLVGVAGDQTSATWNAVTDGTLHSNLVDENGVATAYSIDLGEDVSLSYSADNGGEFFYGYVFFGNQSSVTQNSFTIGGLDDGQLYDLYFYAAWGYADTGSEFSVDGGTNWEISEGIPSEWNASFSEGDNYVKFENVGSSGGEIDGLWRSYAQLTGPDAGKHRGMFSAIQIVAVPEPSAYGLLMGVVACAGIALHRRR